MRSMTLSKLFVKADQYFYVVVPAIVLGVEVRKVLVEFSDTCRDLFTSMYKRGAIGKLCVSFRYGERRKK